MLSSSIQQHPAASNEPCPTCSNHRAGIVYSILIIYCWSSCLLSLMSLEDVALFDVDRSSCVSRCCWVVLDCFDLLRSWCRWWPVDVTYRGSSSAVPEQFQCCFNQVSFKGQGVFQWSSRVVPEQFQSGSSSTFHRSTAPVQLECNSSESAISVHIFTCKKVN